MNKIEVKGARVHNLKNIDVSIPRNKLVVVTGLSGSGKSSLAFDTIYAEGQRRYMETLSAYARQFIGMPERPEVESITGLSPIIAIEQKTTGRNPRSTVGTITEIYDFLRLLFARASTAYSPLTGKEMVKYTDDQIVSLIIDRYRGKKSLLLSPLVSGRKGHYKELFEQLVKKGFRQVRVDGSLEELYTIKPLDRYKVHFIELVVDKILPDPDERSRIRESVTTALHHGKGVLMVLETGSGKVEHFSKNLICPESGISYPDPAPHTFSFNSPQGACPACKGLGVIIKADLSKIIPDDSKSIAKGGIVPAGAMKSNSLYDIFESVSKKYGFSLYDPIREIPPAALNTILYGSDELFRIGEGPKSYMTTFDGIMSRIEQNGNEDDELPYRKERYMEEIMCGECSGTRLKSDALNFKVAGLNIAQVAAMDINALSEWTASLEEQLPPREKLIARDILKEIKERLGFLKGVGLEYLTLDRTTKSLSGGESQRIRLATQIGSKLVNVLYILDEPSIGLHHRDNVKLLSSLKKLRDEGNSVMVVEHDQQTIESCDFLIDLGPGAGEKGGTLLFAGEPGVIGTLSREEIIKHNSLTLEYLKGIRSLKPPASVRKGNGKYLELKGACGNNLKDVDIRIPLGCFIGISGVSGSGKSSLINQTLMPALSNLLNRSFYQHLPFGEITGTENLDKVIEVDQSPIGRTPRSNPATYTGVFTHIRNLFEMTPDAKARGFKASRFSFNSRGGRCEMCNGAGVQIIEMNFLPPVHIKCRECNGKRYKPDTLAVRYKGHSINDVLEMTITRATEFFENIPKIVHKLKTLESVGLGYVRLGQYSTTLSGGESQRLKLASELSRKGTGNTLYILDEPTTGLHFEDIKVLLGVLHKLTDQGNTVIVIEHNLDVLRSVDYIFDMGPEGGEKGGRIVAEGTPGDLRKNPSSVTGCYL